MGDNRSRVVWIVVGVLILLPLIYAVSYLALMVRNEELLLTHILMKRRFPHYRIGGKKAEAFFGPIHYLDRKVRPAYWEARFVKSDEPLF